MVDTVGAGDSLAAGYLAARLRSLDRSAALAVGVANGTASTRAPGGIDGQLDWAAVTAPHRQLSLFRRAAATRTSATDGPSSGVYLA